MKARTRKINYASVCDGIGAVHVAWAPLGWRCSWVSEIDPFCNAVVERRHGHENLGDMTKLTEADLEKHGTIDLLVGGTPCQSFSIAGLRKGLDDPRGNLALRFCQLAGTIRPRWVLWENVPGVMSSLSHVAPNSCPPPLPLDLGRDGAEVEVEDEYDSEELHALNSFLAGLSELGYGLAWRILDAQWFGVPQRRRRLFVVGYFGDWRRAAAVLFERCGLCGHPPPRRKAGQGTAHATAPCIGASGRGFQRSGDSRGQDPVVVAPCLRSNQYNNSDPGMEIRMLVPVAAPRCFGGNNTQGEIETASAVNARGGAGRMDFEIDNKSDPGMEARMIEPIAFNCKQAGDGGEVSPPLRAMGHDTSHANGGGQVAVAFQTRIARNGRGQPKEITDALTSSEAGSHADSKPHVAGAFGVRRLTPRECERLQGFPDDYTLIDFRGKPAKDSPRYKALGNSMVVPVMRWIGERIMQVESIERNEPIPNP